MAFTKKQLAECAARELQKRKENYPRWVHDRRMQQRVADEQIAMMEAIYRLLINLSDEQVLNQN